MSYYVKEFGYIMQRMNSEQWMLLLIAVVVFGVFCMRGFGSRSNY